jgi:hypothetical protein
MSGVTTRDDGVEIRPLRSGEERSLNQTFNEVFGCERPLDEWSWKFAPPGQRSRILVGATADGEVVSHYATRVERLRVGGQTVTAGQVVDVFSRRRPEAVHRRLYERTVRAFFQTYGESGELPLLYGFPGGRALRLGRLRLGYGTPVPIAFLRRELPPPTTPAPRRTGLRRAAARAGLPLPWTATGPAAQLPVPAAGALWERVSGRYPVAVVRDQSWWTRRYLAHPRRPYRYVVAGRGRRIEALAMLQVEDEVLRWVDLLWDGAGPALVHLEDAAYEVARSAGCRRMEAWLSGDPAASGALQARDWRSIPHPLDLHVAARSFREGLDGDRVARDIYLTWGDSDLV